MQRGSFLYFDYAQYIGVFQLVESVIWNHEVVSSSLASYTNGLFV
jgi:hypothetical protein